MITPNGQRTGKALQYYTDGSCFDGFMFEDLPSKGRFYFANGDFYQGAFEEGLFHGIGQYVFGDKNMDCAIKNATFEHGLLVGQQTISWKSEDGKNQFEIKADFVKGKPQGELSLTQDTLTELIDSPWVDGQLIENQEAQVEVEDIPMQTTVPAASAELNKMPLRRSNTIDEDVMSDEPTPQITPQFEAKERSNNSSFATEQTETMVSQNSQQQLPTLQQTQMITEEQLKFKIGEALMQKQQEVDQQMASERQNAEENLRQEREARAKIEAEKVQQAQILAMKAKELVQSEEKLSLMAKSDKTATAEI